MAQPRDVGPGKDQLAVRGWGFTLYKHIFIDTPIITRCVLDSYQLNIDSEYRMATQYSEPVGKRSSESLRGLRIISSCYSKGLL